MKKTKKRYPKKYIPKSITKKDKIKQKKEIEKSKREYKKGKFYTRKKLGSFKTKLSPHVKKAYKIYNLDKIKINKSLSKKTGCSIKSLKKIVNKGKGAYYSSGSRPNQTAESWGIARLSSSITGGKSSAIDYNILKEGCKKNSKALKLANNTKKIHKKGKRKVPKINI